MKSRPILFLGCLVALCTAGFAADADSSPPPIHVALILDDGPVPTKSAAFVKLFKEKGVVVTFSFVIGSLDKNLADGRAVVAAGHEVANHSFNHLHPAQLSEAELEHEIGDAQSRFAEALGVTPRLYWQPFAELTDTVIKLTKKHGLELVRGPNVVATLDFLPNLTGEQIFKRATENIADGTVINFHEWRDETLAQMPAIIDELRRQGCVFMTVGGLVDYVSQRDGAAAPEPRKP